MMTTKDERQPQEARQTNEMLVCVEHPISSVALKAKSLALTSQMRTFLKTASMVGIGNFIS